MNLKLVSRLSHRVKVLERKLARTEQSRADWQKCAQVQGGDIKRIAAENKRLKAAIANYAARLDHIIKTFDKSNAT